MREALLSFRCCMDEDIENFLHNKAIEFVERGLCAVYLLMDEESFREGILKIDAYFTLSHKSLIADQETMSKSSIKRYGGFSTVKTLDFILIGHLGKMMIKNVDDSIYKSAIPGTAILNLAFEVARSASDLIPCKHILVECSDEKKVQKVYTDYGFTYFQNDGKHNQYCKLVYD